ncbi:hypothetical protein TIFTF001_015239 [Ficus carica]|uniref:Uncharacterized protein n=1 Tax=Ficus carica TaxID=3494 RepID=A0AA88AS83_FICCA|nr:hypothetical protein TIFTF001_015239 [Ficus carica]
MVVEIIRSTFTKGKEGGKVRHQDLLDLKGGKGNEKEAVKGERRGKREVVEGSLIVKHRDHEIATWRSDVEIAQTQRRKGRGGKW